MSITTAVVASMDSMFAPLFILPPVLSVVMFSTLLSLITLGFNRLLMKKEVVKGLKDRMKELNKTIKQATKDGDKETMSSSMKEMMTLNRSFMRENMKVMAASMVVGIVFFVYMSAKYSGLTIPVLGFNINWLYWYVITSLAISMLLRKVTGDI